jgi:hypothetical protein
MEYKEYENQMKFTQRHNEIKKAKEVLEKHGYYVHNLYNAEDVQYLYECTEQQALQVLESSMDNDGTNEQISYSIRYFAEEMGLKEKP